MKQGKQAMALTKADREYIRLSMSEIMDEKLKPVIEVNQFQDKDIREVRQTVYGINNDNGLNGDIKTMKKQLQRFWVFSGVAQGIAVGVGVWIKSIMGKG